MCHHKLRLFSDRGGEFLVPLSDFVSKAFKIKAIVFDWDGVFNDGVKGDNVYSYFSEVDSMGLNVLRFGYKLMSGNILIAGVVSGEKNPSAEKFITREHLNFKCLGFKNKIEGLQNIMKEFHLKAEEIAFVFDDILDLSVAEVCGLRFQVKHNAAPMFSKYVRDNNLADYVTANQGSNFAVREISELLLATIGKYDEAVTARYKFQETYSEYINARNTIEAITYTPITTY